MVNVLNILGAPQKLVSLIKIMENVAKFEKELYKVSANNKMFKQTSVRKYIPIVLNSIV